MLFGKESLALHLLSEGLAILCSSYKITTNTSSENKESKKGKNVCFCSCRKNGLYFQHFILIYYGSASTLILLLFWKMNRGNTEISNYKGNVWLSKHMQKLDFPSSASSGYLPINNLN